MIHHDRTVTDREKAASSQRLHTSNDAATINEPSRKQDSAYRRPPPPLPCLISSIPSPTLPPTVKIVNSRLELPRFEDYRNVYWTAGGGMTAMTTKILATDRSLRQNHNKFCTVCVRHRARAKQHTRADIKPNQTNKIKSCTRTNKQDRKATTYANKHHPWTPSAQPANSLSPNAGPARPRPRHTMILPASSAGGYPNSYAIHHTTPIQT